MRFLLSGNRGPFCRRYPALLILWILLWGLSGCLVRRRERIPVAATPAAPVWRNASLQELLRKIQTTESGIKTLDAAATIEPTVTSTRSGEIVNYRDVRTFILLRQPAFIRMIGLYPVVQNKAFDMTSDGKQFRLYIPSKNEFVIGKSQGNDQHSQSALENLRPQAILDALLVKGPEPGNEEAVLEVFTEGNNSDYLIHILRIIPGQWPVLARNIWFERRGLSLSRLQVFDENAEVVTDVLYSDYVKSSGIPYPREIIVERPKDFYALRLLISSLTLNQPIEDAKFHLEQPPGTELKILDQQSESKNEGNGG